MQSTLPLHRLATRPIIQLRRLAFPFPSRHLSSSSRRLTPAEQPKIAAYESIGVSLKPGEEVWWCRCGRSQEQPFCDGSHEGTGLEPLQWLVPPPKNKPDDTTTPRTIRFCQCKHTKTPPICDGSHKQLKK
ncbi:hypothetical protein M427DRAFT_141476 [Gonapodya prolifera JEL478]|uniref:Iron-binding zinc finger CDGSH type domain-containing protein n=1 Tax=Gonapodya prolifera (strain JEL478) TaxID=1344416 RepID=A0A138ZX17_GONPJ|nr:hypothetical protein M427DRAFT_141476 [Gonapodya prolifera JEL478]|eukprot:KXS09062.1 hypothetical protein M427DRAFT_141476 [Gonapodya prolifera JEL478]